MKTKKFLLTSLVAFIVYEILSSLTHMVLMAGQYEATADVWRPDMWDVMWVMHVLYIILVLLFVYIYTRWDKKKATGAAAGAYFGLIIGLLMNAMGMFSQWAVYPLPFSMAVQWFIYGMITFIIMGMVVGAMDQYKPKKKVKEKVAE